MTDAKSSSTLPATGAAATARAARNRLRAAKPLRRAALAVLLMLGVYWNLPVASEFHCVRGQVAEADIGDGVLMRTCLWEQQQRMIRVGPLELIKNGVLILKTQTDANGQLHGQFSSWDDAGVLIESGRYVRGLKQGTWMIADSNGTRRFLHYRGGVLNGL